MRDEGRSFVLGKQVMKLESNADARGHDRAKILKTGAIAVALGVATWLLTPLLLPVRVPEDFPRLPDVGTMNPELRALLQNADREARRRPGSAELVSKLGLAYHANLLFAQATGAYRIAARLAPGDYRWIYCQALLEEENGNEKEELRLLRKTLQLKPDHVPALIKMADSFFKQDQLDQAASYYERAARVLEGGASLQAAFGLGRVAARRREWNRVIADIAPLSPTYAHVAPPYELLLEAYEALGQADKAAAARQNMALARWKTVPPPDDPMNEQLIGVCYSSTRLLKQAGLLNRLGHPDRALQIARRAAQAEPADADVRNFIASTLISYFGDRPDATLEALTQVGECLRLRPDDPLPLWNFTNDFFKTPKPLAVVERLSALLRPYAGLEEAHFSLGQVADARGDVGEAVSQYQAALKRNPNDSGIYNKLGQTMDKAGKFEEAIAHFQRAIQLNPLNTGARFNMAIAFMQQGNYGHGLKEFSELLRLNPHDPATHFGMGFAFLYSKRNDEAIRAFREGLRYRQDDPEAHFGLGSAFAAQHRPEYAVAELRAALRLRPDFPAAQELLAQIEH